MIWLPTWIELMRLDNGIFTYTLLPACTFFQNSVSKYEKKRLNLAQKSASSFFPAFSLVANSGELDSPLKLAEIAFPSP